VVHPVNGPPRSAAATASSPASDARSPDELHREKLAWVRANGVGSVPSNAEWLRALPPSERARLSRAARRKPSRTLSGIATVAVMTAPAPCPHGRCTYCPGGVENRSPQSYTGEEPSALRGAQFGYDARGITEHRLRTLEAIGHPTSKVEAIVMGGTFPSRPSAYRESVFRGIFDGLNGERSTTLEAAHRLNEAAAHRCVGLTVETRPDWCDGRILPDLLDSGVTRVEIGAECLRDEVLYAVGRAHGVAELRAATREARDRGLKVGYHVMLGLPGMTPERDLEDFDRLFSDPGFRPDSLKIYPTLVLPGTPLFEDWRAGRYEPYSVETAAGVIARAKRTLPAWVRIHRVQRDIPSRLIAAGVRASNLREVALDRLRAAGGRCPCLRCREVGRRSTPDAGRMTLTARAYDAASGTELFLSFEDDESDTVAGYLRLRFPSADTPRALTDPVIRELRVLGSEVAVGAAAHEPAAYQHRGFGRALVARSEEEARAAGFDRIFVTSAVGTRPYYRRLGYASLGPYLAKDLRLD
jgi:elongator complex protein 3